MKIPTYIINLPIRKDRRDHIVNQFANKPEFEYSIVEAQTHEHSVIGLWNTIRSIVQDAIRANKEFILICEDDHLFTQNYSRTFLFESIEEARKGDADVLSGGISGFDNIVQVSDSLFWVNCFSGAQFMIIFNKFFRKILDASFGEKDCADYKISLLSEKVFLIFPFVSVQKEFGYSDATEMNDGTNRVESMFVKAGINAALYNKIRNNYSIPRLLPEVNDGSLYYDMSIPVFILSKTSSSSGKKKAILSEFENRPEFEITLVETHDNDNSENSFNKELINIFQRAYEESDDLIVICNDSHKFTEEYSAKVLFDNIIQAYKYNCDLLTGGVAGFNHAVSVSRNFFWLDVFTSSCFTIVFRKFFMVLIDHLSQNENGSLNSASQLTYHKLVFYPFISKPANSEFCFDKFTVEDFYVDASNRLKKIRMICDNALKV